MQNIFKLLKISAKESFFLLKKSFPLFSEKLSEDIFLTRDFWDHVNFSKPRELRERIERLAMIPLVPKVLKEGEIFSERESFWRFEYHEQELIFCVILQKKSKKIIVLNCFLNKEKSPVLPQRELRLQ